MRKGVKYMFISKDSKISEWEKIERRGQSIGKKSLQI